MTMSELSFSAVPNLGGIHVVTPRWPIHTPAWSI